MAQKIMWENVVLLDVIDKSENVQMHIQYVAVNGVRSINIYDVFTGGPEPKPRRGITIPLHRPINRGTAVVNTLYRVIESLLNNYDKIQELPLYDESKIVYITKGGGKSENK